MSETTSAIESANLGSGDNNPEKARLKIASEKTHWLSQFNERFSEWCSSILVKETRQALKSRQFIWTYLVLLLCVGVWTVLGLSVASSQYEIGKDLLVGYWVILGFPLGLIIPFSAYRSLAREFEDGTIHLMSITTMKPHQIVIGKFGSAILQMVIYLSVLAPCICFTYLLRGISLNQITFGLMICVGGSIGLTILGLFLAGVFRSRTLGIGVSVLFVLLLGWLYYLWCLLSDEFTRYGGIINWDDPDMMMGTFGIVAFFGSTAGLLLVTATAQISFPSDNRATPIRIAMFVQQILFFAFLVVMIPSIPFSNDATWGMMMFAGHYWLIMGFLMIGESSSVSRRVQRTLPRTIFSRSAFSLLMPGAGRGFLFAVANVWTCALVMVLINLFSDFLIDEATAKRIAGIWGARGAAVLDWEDLLGMVTCCFYVTWFLAIIYLVMRLLLEKKKREWSTGVGPTISLVMGALFIALLSIGSFVVHFNFFPYDMRNEVTPPLVFNWYVMVFDVAGVQGSGQTLVRQAIWVFAFFVQAVLVIGIAFAFASRELLVRPIAVPERVQIEMQKTKFSNVPVGESIDEIFGDLK